MKVWIAEWYEERGEASDIIRVCAALHLAFEAGDAFMAKGQPRDIRVRVQEYEVQEVPS